MQCACQRLPLPPPPSRAPLTDGVHRHPRLQLRLRQVHQVGRKADEADVGAVDVDVQHALR